MECIKNIISILGDVSTSLAFIVTAFLYYKSLVDRKHEFQIKIFQYHIDSFTVLSNNEVFVGITAMNVLSVHYTYIKSDSRKLMADSFKNFNEATLNHFHDPSFKSNAYLMEMVKRVIEDQIKILEENSSLITYNETLREQLPKIKLLKFE